MQIIHLYYSYFCPLLTYGIYTWVLQPYISAEMSTPSYKPLVYCMLKFSHSPDCFRLQLSHYHAYEISLQSIQTHPQLLFVDELLKIKTIPPNLHIIECKCSIYISKSYMCRWRVTVVVYRCMKNQNCFIRSSSTM